MRLTVIAILFLFGCSKAPLNADDLSHPDSSWLPVVFLCGQSNMEGVEPTNDVPAEFTQKNQNILIFQKKTNTSLGDGKIEVLEYGKNNNWRDPSIYFGPEEGIGHYVAEAGHRMAIVKYAYGGSKMVYKGSLSPNGYWQTDAKSSLNHYPILISNWADQALDTFRNAGYKPYIAAFIWCQGETDAHDYEAAHAYGGKLTEMLNDFKSDMYAKDPKVNDMRVIITRTRNGYPYSDVIRKAQFDIAKSYHNCYLIDSDSWPLESDGIHFTAKTQAIIHGKAISDILIKVIP